MKEVKQYQQHFDHLKQKHSKRNTIFERMENLYWMNWLEQSKVEKQGRNIKPTLSPRARNKIKGFTWLLAASNPEWSVPVDTNRIDVQPVASKIEQFMKATWTSGGRVRKSPIHYDMSLSAGLYAETHLAITSTKDMLDRAGKDASPGVKGRLERIHQLTPYTFDVWNPRYGYPEFDTIGLRAFGRMFSLSAQEVVEQWEDGQKVLDSRGREFDPFEKIDCKLLYTLDKQIVWIDGAERPLFFDNHGLPFIPVIAQITDGSRLFDNEEDRREPFLYTLAQSHLPERENLILTVMFTLAYALGTGPLFNYQAIDPDRTLNIDKSQPFNVVRTQVGERFDQVAQNIIDPSLLQTWQMALDLEEESTLRGQTLGEPLGQNAPYSMVALLTQAGRLPMVMPQRTLSWALGEAGEMCIQWLKHDKRTGYASSDELTVILKPEEIPDHVQIKGEIDVSLPHDQQIATNIALMGTQGEAPLFSNRYAREVILKIGQSDKMQEEIWSEKASALKAQKYFLQQMAEMSQMEQMAMQPGQASGMPGMPQMQAPVTPPTMPGVGSAPQVAPEDVSQNPFPPEEPLPPL